MDDTCGLPQLGSQFRHRLDFNSLDCDNCLSCNLPLYMIQAMIQAQVTARFGNGPSTACISCNDGFGLTCKFAICLNCNYLNRIAKTVFIATSASIELRQLLCLRPASVGRRDLSLYMLYVPGGYHSCVIWESRQPQVVAYCQQCPESGLSVKLAVCVLPE